VYGTTNGGGIGPGGNLFGRTSFAGAYNNGGTVYELTP